MTTKQWSRKMRSQHDLQNGIRRTKTTPYGNHTRLELHVCRPGLGTTWRGTLREAVSLFPNELNFAVAAALSGPGIDATLVQLDDKPQHAIEAVTYTSVGTFRSSLTLDLSGRHATAEAIIAALERWNQPVKYG